MKIAVAESNEHEVVTIYHVKPVILNCFEKYHYFNPWTMHFVFRFICWYEIFKFIGVSKVKNRQKKN